MSRDLTLDEGRLDGSDVIQRFICRQEPFVDPHPPALIFPVGGGAQMSLESGDR